MLMLACFSRPFAAPFFAGVALFKNLCFWAVEEGMKASNWFGFIAPLRHVFIFYFIFCDPDVIYRTCCLNVFDWRTLTNEK